MGNNIKAEIDELQHTNFYMTINKQAVSSSGWYRIAQFVTSDYNSLNGSSDNSVDIILKRVYNYISNEHHELKFLGIFNNRKFISIANLSNNQLFTKIRYTSSGYLEIYYNGNTFNTLTYTLLNRYDGDLIGYWKKIWEESDTTDDQVLCTFEIPAN